MKSRVLAPIGKAAPILRQGFHGLIFYYAIADKRVLDAFTAIEEAEKVETNRPNWFGLRRLCRN